MNKHFLPLILIMDWLLFNICSVNIDFFLHNCQILT